MSKGELVEQGTHHDLLAREGAYSKLVYSQDLERTNEKNTSEFEEVEDDDTPELEHRTSRRLSLKRTVSSVGSAHNEQGGQPGSAETMGYGLFKCLCLLIKEQPNLWYLYVITAVTSVFGGKSSDAV